MSFLGTGARALFLTLLGCACAGATVTSTANTAPPAETLSPMHGIHEWMAGYSTGDADGTFDRARFGRLGGLVYDPIADRLLVADPGLGSIRTVTLPKNDVGTLGKGDGFNLAGAGLVSPTALAWIEPGTLLAVLDPGRPGLAILDLKSGRVAACLSATPGTAEASLLANGTDLSFAAGDLLVSASSSPDLGLFRVSPQGLLFRKTWDVSNLKNGPGFDALAQDGGRILALRHLTNASRAYSVLSGTDDHPCASFAGPDAGLPLSLTAQEVSLPSLPCPWAFVKDGQSFEVVTRSPYLAAQIRPGGGDGVVWKLGVYDRNDRLIGVEENSLFDKWGKLVYTDPDQNLRLWCEAASYAACDPATRTWYISEPNDGRILSFRPIEGSDRACISGTMPGFAEWNFPVARRKEVTRLAVMNLSRMMLPTDTRRHSDSFSKRLEHWMNALSSLDASPKGYEVCFVGAPYSYEPDGLSSLGQLRSKWADVEREVSPDGLVLVMGPMDLYQTALDFRSRPVLKDGLPAPDFDPEFALSPEPSKLDPTYHEICDYIKKDKDLAPHFFFDKTGKMVGSGLEWCTLDFNRDPFVRSHAQILVRRYLDDLAKKAATGGYQGKRLAVTILYYPDCNGLSDEEVSPQPLSDAGPMRAILMQDCRELGWRFLDISSAMRMFAADDPFMMNANLHPDARGHDDLAFITAWRLLGARLNAAPDGSSAP